MSIAQLWFVYSLALFIVFWERDITSENHGTPIHLHFIVHTTIYLSAFTFISPFLSLALILCKRQGRRNWQLLCTHWEQSYLLCAGPSPGAVTPIVSIFESYWRQILVSLMREICHYLHQPSTWGYQRGELTTLHQEVRSFLGLASYCRRFVENF